METYSERNRELCDDPTLKLNMEKGELYTLVPSSGKGSYTSQPCRTCRPNPTMLMDIVIQPQTHIRQSSMANTHAKQYKGLKPRS